MSGGPLSGVRVLDLSRYLVGGILTRKLADLGADVVKVEHPAGGDALRSTPPFIRQESVFHAVVNRGKRSIAVDVTSESGAAELLALADVADVVVEVSTGSANALTRALDIPALRERRPAVVVCSVSGFGLEGSLAGMASHGLTIAAVSGMLPLEEGSVAAGTPRVASLDHVSPVSIDLPAVNGALAVVASVMRARETGMGAWLDVSCFDAIVEAQRSRLVQVLVGHEGEHVEPLALGPLYALYLTSDERPIQFAAIERKYWDRYCDAVGRPDLKSWFVPDRDYDFGEARLGPVLTKIFRSRTSDEWFEFFLEHGLPASPVWDIETIAQSAHLRERGLVERLPTGLPSVVGPVRWVDGEERPGVGARPAPDLGCDREAVLADWLDGSRP